MGAGAATLTVKCVVVFALSSLADYMLKMFIISLNLLIMGEIDCYIHNLPIKYVF